MKEQPCVQNDVMQSHTQFPILVVDDDYHLRNTIQLMLEEEGFTVRIAADGQEAIELAQEERPALIVLDMGLPLLDGYEVAMQVRSHYDTDVPIILITADGQAQEKSQRVGANAYLRKPFDLDDLIQVVQQALAKQ